MDEDRVVVRWRDYWKGVVGSRRKVMEQKVWKNEVLENEM